MKNVNWYDEECKKLLSDKQVLLNILKREVDEYQGLSDEEILKLIVISPNDEASGKIGTMDLLSLLFGDKVSAEQMIERIEQDYGIKWSTERRREVMSAKGWGQSMIDEAMEKGLYEGLEKGKTAGHREGLEKGIVNMKKAVKMLHCGMDIGQIIEETGLEEKQIIELKEIMDSPVMMVAEENHHFSHHD